MDDELKASCGVLLIARDEEKVIGASLESLKKQTLSPYIVVVDDGSEDETRNISSKYAGFIVKLLATKRTGRESLSSQEYSTPASRYWRRKISTSSW